jgi:hypothetical protein
VCKNRFGDSVREADLSVLIDRRSAIWQFGAR